MLMGQPQKCIALGKRAVAAVTKPSLQGLGFFYVLLWWLRGRGRGLALTDTVVPCAVSAAMSLYEIPMALVISYD